MVIMYNLLIGILSGIKLSESCKKGTVMVYGYGTNDCRFVPTPLLDEFLKENDDYHVRSYALSEDTMISLDTRLLTEWSTPESVSIKELDCINRKVLGSGILTMNDGFYNTDLLTNFIIRKSSDSLSDSRILDKLVLLTMMKHYNSFAAVSRTSFCGHWHKSRIKNEEGNLCNTKCYLPSIEELEYGLKVLRGDAELNKALSNHNIARVYYPGINESDFYWSSSSDKTTDPTVLVYRDDGVIESKSYLSRMSDGSIEKGYSLIYQRIK